jgi:hypothetical protein
MPKTHPRNFDCPETGRPCLDGECLKGRCHQREVRQRAEAGEESAKKQRIHGAEIIESLEEIQFAIRKNRISN